MAQRPTIARVELTEEEVRLLVPVLETLLGVDRRTALLAARVAARIRAAIPTPALPQTRLVEKKAWPPPVEHRCPKCERLLRLDASSIGAMSETYYCPTRDCGYACEVVR